MKVSVNIKMDICLKNQVKELLAKNMTTAINMFLLAVVKEGKIPFEINDTFLNDKESKYEEFFAQKIKIAEQQEKAGMMRDFDTFVSEVDNFYGEK